MTFNFYLGSVAKKSTDKTAIVYLYLRTGASKKGEVNTIKINTGIKVLPRLWNPKKKCLRSGRERPSETEAKYISTTNTKLSGIKTDAQKVIDTLQASGKKFSFSEIQKEVEKVVSPSFIAEERKTFDQAKKNFVESIKDDTTDSYQTRFQVLFNILDDYSLKCKKPISFELFDSEFATRFKNYLLETRNHNNNTANKTFKLLKQVLSYCIKHKYFEDQSFRDWKTPKYIQPNIISLTEDELEAINDLELSKDDALYKVRECFIFQCNTGARISDILAIQWNQIDFVRNEWSFRTKKTRKDVSVPLTKTALSILKKNKENDDRRPLNLISSQKINEHLKTLCENAKINSIITIIRNEGNKVVRVDSPKHSLISTHVAKKTFVTLSLQNGMRVETLLKITGQDYKSLKPYIEINDKAKHTEMKKVWDKRKLKVVS